MKNKTQWKFKLITNLKKEIKQLNRRATDVLAHFVSIFIYNKDSKIIDIAAGTGLASESLKIHGFRNIDALDPSIEMLKIAQTKDLYKNYFCEGVYKDKKCSLLDGSLPYF